jgi:peptidoglycan/xylan/chitin deacetylase (PgdA/CDA1 family)
LTIRTTRWWIAVLAAAAGSALAFGVLQGSHTVRNRSFRGLAPLCRVQTNQRIVALTFDDGPDPVYTPQALSLLADFHARATFFLTGRHAKEFPGLVDREVRAGMEVGNHTWSHPHLTGMSTDQVRSQVTHATELLAGTGTQLRFFRAPYGEISANQLATVGESGLITVHWSLAVDTYVGDGAETPEQIGARLASDVRPGDIILAHDARILSSDNGSERRVAMSALRSLLTRLRQKRFEVTTVATLLADRSSLVRAQLRPWFWQKGFTCPNPSQP